MLIKNIKWDTDGDIGSCLFTDRGLHAPIFTSGTV